GDVGDGAADGEGGALRRRGQSAVAGGSDAAARRDRAVGADGRRAQRGPGVRGVQRRGGQGGGGVPVRDGGRNDQRVDAAGRATPAKHDGGDRGGPRRRDGRARAVHGPGGRYVDAGPGAYLRGGLREQADRHARREVQDGGRGVHGSGAAGR